MIKFATFVRLAKTLLPSVLLIGAIAPLAQAQFSVAQAQIDWFEREAVFYWTAVPGTLSRIEPSDPNSDWEFIFMNEDNIVRRGALVSFEIVTPNGEYGEFFGNCETTHITARLSGEFITQNRVRYRILNPDWQLAAAWRLAILNFAGEQADSYPVWFDSMNEQSVPHSPASS
jgi:hypothetical protein